MDRRTDDLHSATSAFLSRVPLLSGLSAELLDRLACETTLVRVRAGEWLMREGEVAESLYVVQSGRLEVVVESCPEEVVRVVRRGEIIGELALLQAGTRSASVRARRDSELLELGRGAFERLIQEAPSFALGLTRSIGAHLAANRAPASPPRPPTTIAVVALDGAAPAREVARTLASALGHYGTVAELAEGSERSARELIPALDRAEREADRIVVQPGTKAWDEVAMREAELLLAVTSGRPDSLWLRSPAMAGCELLSVGARLAPEALRHLQPRETQVVADRNQMLQSVALLARRLAGRALGVVLSGGGARAFAHVGVLEELSAAGVQVDRLGGASLGSLVAAKAATGLRPDAIYESFVENFLRTNPSNDFTLPVFSLVRGSKTRRMIRAECGTRHIEELPLRFFCVSCDLVAREQVVHRTGLLADALYASLAIPAVFPPAATPDGRLLVDGGVLDNLPVATMARSGEGPVIAVDVTGRPSPYDRPTRPRLARLARPLRRALTGGAAPIPRLGDTVLRTLTVGSIDTVAAARRHADLVIAPRVEGVGVLEWGALPRVREIGRQAARAALDAGLPDRLRP